MDCSSHQLTPSMLVNDNVCVVNLSTSPSTVDVKSVTSIDNLADITPPGQLQKNTVDNGANGGKCEYNGEYHDNSSSSSCQFWELTDDDYDPSDVPKYLTYTDNMEEASPLPRVVNGDLGWPSTIERRINHRVHQEQILSILRNDVASHYKQESQIGTRGSPTYNLYTEYISPNNTQANPSVTADDKRSEVLEALTEAHILAMYDAVDVNEDGVITLGDMYAFLSINPNCIETRNTNHNESSVWAQNSPKNKRRKPPKQRNDEKQVMSNVTNNCSPFRTWSGEGRKRQTHLNSNPYISYKDNSVSDDLALITGYRLEVAIRDHAFVDFFLKMSFSIRTNKQPLGGQTHELSPIKCGVSHQGSIMRSFALKHTENNSTNEDSFRTVSDTADDKALSTVYFDHHTEIPTFVTREAFYALYHEIEEILNSGKKSLLLDMSMIRSVQSFFNYVKAICDRNGTLNKTGERTSTRNQAVVSPNVNKIKMENDVRSVDLQKVQQSQKVTQPLDINRSQGACPSNLPNVEKATHNNTIASIYWMLASWEQPRGILKVPILQCFAELYLKSKAKQQEKDMWQFTRYYNHLLYVQRQRGRSKRAANENLSLLRLSSYFSFVFAEADSNLGDSGNTISSCKNNGINDENSGYYTLNSALKTPRLNGSNKGRNQVKFGTSPSPDGDFEMGYPLAPRNGHRKRIANSSKIPTQNDFIIHSLVEPDSLTLIGSLGSKERKKIASICFWALVRACLYGLMAGLAIASADVLTIYFLSSGTEESLYEVALTSIGVNAVAITEGVLGYTPYFFDNWLRKVNTADIYSFNKQTELLLKEKWKYTVILMVVTILVSAIEVIVLYIDALKASFGMGKAGGIPMYHFAERRGDHYLRSDDNEVASAKESLIKKKIKFVMRSISVASLEIDFPTKTVFGIDVANTNITCLQNTAKKIWPKIKRAGPTFILRVIVSRLSQYAAPFISTPFLIFWNYIIARQTQRRVKTVILGTIASEGLADRLLSIYFEVPPNIIRHNARVHDQRRTAAGCKAGGNILVEGLYYAPFHVYREIMALITFYMRIVGTHSVHPALHLFIVHIASHLQMPDMICGYGIDVYATPSSSNKFQTHIGKSGSSERIPQQAFHEGRAGTLMKVWLSELCVQLNSARRKMKKDDSWREQFIFLHRNEPDSEHIASTLSGFFPFCRISSWKDGHGTKPCFTLRKQVIKRYEMQHLLEVTFPTWACIPLHYTSVNGHKGFITEVFSLREIQLFAVIAAICVVLSPLEQQITRRESYFLEHIFKVYLSAQRMFLGATTTTVTPHISSYTPNCSNNSPNYNMTHDIRENGVRDGICHSHYGNSKAWCHKLQPGRCRLTRDQKAKEFVKQISEVRAAYLSGISIDIHHFIDCLERCSVL